MPRPTRSVRAAARHPQKSAAVERQAPAERGISSADPGSSGESAASALPSSAIHAMPGHLVRRLQQVHAALFSEECADHGLTSVQFAALVVIGENPGIDATRLSAVIAFDRSTIGGVLERLELRGWIARAARHGDRRIKLLYLTPAGRAELDATHPAVSRVQERVLAPLAPEDRARFLGLLTQLVELHRDTPEIGPS